MYIHPPRLVHSGRWLKNEVKNLTDDLEVQNLADEVKNQADEVKNLADEMKNKNLADEIKNKNLADDLWKSQHFHNQPSIPVL